MDQSCISLAKQSLDQLREQREKEMQKVIAHIPPNEPEEIRAMTRSLNQLLQSMTVKG